MSAAGDADGVGSGSFTEESAGEVLAETCRAAGLEHADAELIRLGSNAVYRLPSAGALVRIGGGTADLKFPR